MLTAQRFIAFWFANSSGNPLQDGHLSRTEWITSLFTLFSIPGLFLVWHNNRHAARLLVLWLTGFPLIYYLTQFAPRYRHPILWATLLPAGYLVVEFLFGIAGK